MSVSDPSWSEFQARFFRDPELGISLDWSRMGIGPEFLEKMAPLCEKAFAEMRALEGGAIANPDEGRMVGHYWLRNAALAPSSEIREEIESGLASSARFAEEIHTGTITAPSGGKFTKLLLVGIGGSALGPQLVGDCLMGEGGLKTWHLDNTDPDGIDRTLRQIASEPGGLADTLVVVTSKSGGTPETRNGMLETKAAFEAAGLDFARHAAAVTGVGSKLDKAAEAEGWITRFPMEDWVGGRTSVTGIVGLVPARLQKVDVDAFLAGAAAMDEQTRTAPTEENFSMLLALAWHAGCNGAGEKDMVVLPYKDRLIYLSKYLQQLVMESLGKRLDRQGNEVCQGLAVYGNKGSTDQHAYVQQLRDGVNNFFAVFIEVARARAGASIEVEPDTTSGDYLQGFLRGTRAALFEGDRLSVTISVPQLGAFELGALIAMFERATSFYATLIDVNAYHQPGVESGKKAATTFLDLLAAVRSALAESGAEGATAETISAAIEGSTPEDVWHCLSHLSANDASIEVKRGEQPADDLFMKI